MELFEDVSERLGPSFSEAQAAGDLEGVTEVQRQVQAWLHRLYGLFRKTLLAPDVRQYVIASMYDAYDLLFACATSLGQGEDASSLQVGNQWTEERLGEASHEAVMARMLVVLGVLPCVCSELVHNCVIACHIQ